MLYITGGFINGTVNRDFMVSIIPDQSVLISAEMHVGYNMLILLKYRPYYNAKGLILTLYFGELSKSSSRIVKEQCMTRLKFGKFDMHLVQKELFENSNASFGIYK
jgi:hypothetical protein